MEGTACVCRSQQWVRGVRGQSAGQKHPKLLLASFQSQAQQVAPSSVTGPLVRVVSRVQGAVQSAARSPDLHRPVAARQEQETGNRKIIGLYLAIYDIIYCK